MLPELNVTNIVPGADAERHGAFNSRSCGRVPSLQLFINQLRYYEKIERKIARKGDKVTYHFKKWTNLLSILKDD